MINARVDSPSPNARIGYGRPNARVSSFQTGRTNDRPILPGMPIGLLLALTYAEMHAINNFGDHRPNVRLRTT